MAQERRSYDQGIKISNILQSLILAAILGTVGIIWDLKNTVSDMHTVTQVNNTRIVAVENEVQSLKIISVKVLEHQANQKIHHEHQ